MSFINTLKNRGLIKDKETLCIDPKDDLSINTDLDTIREEFGKELKTDEERLKAFDEIEQFHLELGYDKNEYRKMYEEAKKKGVIKESERYES